MSEGVGCSIGSGVASIKRVNPPKKEDKARGDRNYWQSPRLRGGCPKCKMIVPTVQTVDHHESWATITHWCKYCNKVLRTQTYPLTSIRKIEEQWEKEGMKYARRA